MKNYKKILALVLAGAMTVSMAACAKSGGDTKTEEPAKTTEENKTDSSEGEKDKEGEVVKATSDGKSPDNDLVIAIEGSVSSLDPHNIPDTNAISATRGMYENLVVFDSEYNLIGGLAKDGWEISDDSLTYTFKLNEGIKFHDGTDFNAAAVVANYERVVNKENNLRTRRNFVVTNSDETEKLRVASIETPDDYTVIFHMTEPYSTFINKLTQFSIISPAAIEQHGNDVMRNPVGTGPFKYDSWTEGNQTKMVKNADYWGTVPSVDSVTIREVPEAGSRTAMLQTGEADFIYPMPADQLAAVEGVGDIAVNSVTSNIMRYVTLNTEIPELADVKVRQAMNHAIDKNAYIEVMFSGYGTAASSVVPEVISYYKAQEPYAYDIEKAKALMTEAGYPDGFKLTLWGDNSTQEIKGMTFIQQQLAQIGIEVEVMPMEPATVSDKIYVEKEEAEINMWYVNWSASDFSADGSMRSLLHSTMIPPTSANTVYYNNPEFDSLLDQGLATADPAELEPLYAEAQTTAWNDAVWLFLGNDKVIYSNKSYLSGVTVCADGRFDYAGAVLAQ